MNQCIFSIVILGIGPTGIKMKRVPMDAGPESNVALIKIVVFFKESHSIFMSCAVAQGSGNFYEIKDNGLSVEFVSFKKLYIGIYGCNVALRRVIC